MAERKYERPAATVDVVMFTVAQDALRVLLIQRAQSPFAGHWALPGGFVHPHERLGEAAVRELREETGVITNRLQQLHAFGAPGRDPRGWTITIAFLALIGADAITLATAHDEVRDAAWFALPELPELAFDHALIIACAERYLRSRAADLAWVCGLLPQTFTLGELQRMVETVAGEAVDKRNFRRKVLAQGLLEPTTATRYGDHRPAQLYRLCANLPGPTDRCLPE